MAKTQSKLPYVGEFLFRQLDDYRFHCIFGNYDGLVADFCDEFDIAIPDDCQFLRVRSYARGLHFEFRDYGGKIRINIHPLEL